MRILRKGFVVTNMTWEEPAPSAGGGRGRKSSVFTDEVQEALKSNPGKWAVIIAQASSSSVSNAQSWAKKRPGFEVTSRTIAEQRDTDTPYKVYSRFNPEKVEADEARIAAEADKKAAAKSAAQPVAESPEEDWDDEL